MHMLYKSSNALFIPEHLVTCEAVVNVELVEFHDLGYSIHIKITDVYSVSGFMWGTWVIFLVIIIYINGGTII